MAPANVEKKFEFKNSKGETVEELSIEFLVENTEGEIILAETLPVEDQAVYLNVDDAEIVCKISQDISWYRDKMLTRHNPIPLEEVPGCTLRVEVIEPAPFRRTHPEGKICGECKILSRAKGREFRDMITHKFAEGDERMYRVILDTLVEGYDAEAITNDNVGYCSIVQGITADCAPACEEGFQEVDTDVMERAKSKK